jgi:hypothetical protein
MKLSIIPSDKAVYKDGLCYLDLDLSSVNIPVDIHALQWDNNAGHIEYKNNVKLAEAIDTLPSWANEAYKIWVNADTKAKAAAALLEQENPVIPATLTDSQKLDLIKIDRNARLAACDWTQLSDVPNTVNKEAWATYRQALRDFPNNPSLNVDSPVWPAPPTM